MSPPLHPHLAQTNNLKSSKTCYTPNPQLPIPSTLTSKLNTPQNLRKLPIPTIQPPNHAQEMTTRLPFFAVANPFHPHHLLLLIPTMLSLKTTIISLRNTSRSSYPSQRFLTTTTPTVRISTTQTTTTTTIFKTTRTTIQIQTTTNKPPPTTTTYHHQVLIRTIHMSAL